MPPSPDQYNREIRRAEAAFALFTLRDSYSRREVLTQWNLPWQRYSLIGGRREVGESFRDCCVREIEEELGLRREVDFQVAATSLVPRCEYRAHSQRRAEETYYVFEVFRATMESASALALVTQDKRNRWLTEHEVQFGATKDGAAVAGQAGRILRLYGTE